MQKNRSLALISFHRIALALRTSQQNCEHPLWYVGRENPRSELWKPNLIPLH